MKTLYAWFSSQHAALYGSLIYEDENGHDVEVTHISGNKDAYEGIKDKRFVGLVKEGCYRKSDRVPSVGRLSDLLAPLPVPEFKIKIPELSPLRMPEFKIPQPALYSGPTSRPQVIVPGALLAPKPRRNGLARWWSNGYSFVRPKDKPGLCSLKVTNGTDRDAVVKMVSGTQGDKISAGLLCRFVYICAGKSVTIQGIGAHEYRLFFSTGTHWDKGKKSFSQSQAAQKFVDPIKFTQLYEMGSVKYSTNEVTLHPVPGGSARTTRVDQEEFDRLQ